MNILAWNVQGLGNDWTFQILHDYVQQYSPPLVFLSETLCSKSQMKRWRIKLGYTGMLIWEKEGRSGGLCLFWSDTVSVQLLSGSKGHIDVLVTSHNYTCWRFTGLYGSPDTSLRNQFWNLLKRLADSSSLPWLCGGDLNEILFSHEKQGGERLDRMLGNREWMDLFPNSRVHHLNLWGSDHRPLLVELLQVDEFSILGKSWKRGHFHFEEAWVEEAGCSHIIKEHWNNRSADSLEGVADKLRSCASDLEQWNLESFRSLKSQVKKTKTAFDRVDKQLSSHNWKEHQRLEKALVALRYKEERYWKQRSKDTWLKCGDRNSKFFHKKASARQAKNSISGLLDSNEKWCDTEQGMAQIIESHFETLFSSSSHSLVEFDRVLDTIDRKVTTQMNEQLDQVFGLEDVKEAVFQMALTKSPGADGMSAVFYQSFWSVVGEEVTMACLGFTNRGLPLGSINETIITLIPKIKNPTRITEFRPISLCNVLYKIISKMLANRLRKVMDNIISEEQSAFIPGRLISDNAIIGFECLHAIKRRKTKKNYMALKLDMEKAYDMVEWDFIQRVMDKLGFSAGWTKKIMACISSISYSFQFNGQMFGHLNPSWGLRQGDPLSPYLGPIISHLLFADDSLLFLEAKTTTCATLKEALNSYEAASGQAVNLSKSAVCFGPKLLEDEAASMAAILGVPRVRELHRLCAQFWWGGNSEKKRMHWCTWEKLCVHKADGGMGFRDLRSFNRALLAKQAWRIHSSPTSLVSRVLKGFYFQTSSFLQVKANSTSSFVWRSILWGRGLYMQGIRRKIGSGEDTFIYHDGWLPRDGVFKISSP
ncbi:hypothetical protein UlMin_034718 [Ulmus minor]